MLLALLGIMILFSALTGGVFYSPRNLSLLARQMSVTGILASAMVLVIVSGQIDLSVGAMAGLCGAVATMLCLQAGLPVPIAFALALVLGGLLGAAQGFLVSSLGVPSFIVSLGGMLIFQGSLLGLTKGVSLVPPSDFLAVGQNFLPPVAGWALVLAWVLYAEWQARADLRARLRAAGKDQRSYVRRARLWRVSVLLPWGFIAVFNAYQGLPLPVLLMLGICFAFWVLGAHTPFGRQLYALGGNPEAAFYAGIPVKARLLGVFVLMGVTAAAAGLVLTARVGAASADAGRMLELDAIAAAVIGGASLLGGRGNVWGALLGACVMASLDNGLSLMNTEAFWQPVIKGAILVAAVGVDLRMRGKR
jgi:D-xylose transport system permease protein